MSTPRMLALLITASLCAACTASPAPAATIAPSAAAQITAAPPTSAPQPTAAATIASGVHVGSIAIGGLTLDAARAKLTEQAAQTLPPIDVQAGAANESFTPDTLGLQPDLDAIMAAAQSAGAGSSVPPSVRVDEAKLRAALDAFGHDAATPPSISVLTDTEEISRSFVLTPGQKLDLDAAAKQVAVYVAAGSTGPLSLTLAPDTTPVARPSAEQLQAQIEAMAKEWNGIVGIYAYDLDTHQPVATLNQDSVFSGASVMKVPILLHAYVKLNPLSADQQDMANKMIIKSDNLAANALLAASAGGQGTDDAYTGVLDMSAMLKDLGLEHTYQYMPYEAYDYLVGIRKIKIQEGPAKEGAPPFTEPDPVVRTTPAEMSEVFLWLDDCSNGIGLLLDKFSSQITPQRCKEMLQLLRQNDDHTRMVAGFPPGTEVYHKSGWIEDMQSDVGIVHSAGGNFLVGIYLYRQIIPGKNYLADEIATPVIANFARLIYSYYNPTVLGAAAQSGSTVPTPSPTVLATDAAPTAAAGQATAAAQGSDVDTTPTTQP